MQLSIKLSESDIQYHLQNAYAACRYWQHDATEAEKLPNTMTLKKALSRPINIVNPNYLKIIAQEDLYATDCLVQCALFGKCLFG